MTEHLKEGCYEDISTKVRDFYNSKGLEYREPLGLIPREDDKSVTFTSATINNFKAYLRGEEEIPVNGVYTIQSCLRTRNLDHRYGFEKTPRFGSYFRMFGLIRRSDFLLETYADAIEFVESELGIPSESIVVHKSSKHEIFNELMDGNSKQNWFEDKIDWYNWEYGEEDIRGEGISIEIPNKSNLAETQVIGNIVVIYKKDEPIAVEWGFGLETTTSRLEGFPHPIFSSVIGERYLHKNNYCINEKDILFLDYANILYHLEENDVKQGKDKYVDRTIKQLFQGLSIQIFLTRRNISDLEDLIGRRKNGLFEEFERYNDSFQERVSLFLNSYRQIVSNYSGRRNEKKIEETINKSAQKYGFNKELKETIIKFINSDDDGSIS